MRQARQRERAMVERVAVFVRRGDVPAVMGESGKLRPCRETKCPLMQSPEDGSNLRVLRLPLWATCTRCFMYLSTRYLR